jgi:hypothetical protein
MEAEIIAASEGGKESVWLNKLANDLQKQNADHLYTPTLFCDNLGTVELLYDTKFHRRAKHIEIRHLYMRNDLVETGKLKVQHIPGEDQPVDILTKQLPIEAFNKHCRTLGLTTGSA